MSFTCFACGLAAVSWLASSNTRICQTPNKTTSGMNCAMFVLLHEWLCFSLCLCCPMNEYVSHYVSVAPWLCSWLRLCLFVSLLWCNNIWWMQKPNMYFLCIIVYPITISLIWVVCPACRACIYTYAVVYHGTFYALLYSVPLWSQIVCNNYHLLRHSLTIDVFIYSIWIRSTPLPSPPTSEMSVLGLHSRTNLPT